MRYKATKLEAYNEVSEYCAALHARPGSKPLTLADELALAAKIQQGDQAALNTLVEANMRFVVSFAQKYIGNGLPIEDLIAEGNAALIVAAQKFDPSKGFKFISYAVWWIRQHILAALYNHGATVRLPHNVYRVVKTLRVSGDKLTQKLGRFPDLNDYREEFSGGLKGASEEFTLNAVDILSRGYDNTVSLDAEVSDGIYLKETLEEFVDLPPDVAAEKSESGLRVHRLLKRSTLTHRETEVIKLYFGLFADSHVKVESLEQIAERFDLTRERVRQIKEKALAKLRKGNPKLLADFLECRLGD